VNNRNDTSVGERIAQLADLISSNQNDTDLALSATMANGLVCVTWDELRELSKVQAHLHACHEGNARLQRERNQLRAALDAIYNLHDGNILDRTAEDDAVAFVNALDIARRALDGLPPQPPPRPDADDDGELAPFGQWPQWAGAHDGEGA